MKFLSSLLLGSSVTAAGAVRGRRVKDADKILGRNQDVRHRNLQQTNDGPVPTQSYYIPLPEEQMFENIFKEMNGKSKSPIESLIAFSIANEGTVIWYDHWEDGYELNIADGSAHSKTTQVWGDGDPSNGCAPGVKVCTEKTDVFAAGDTVVIQNTVPVEPRRDPSVIKFDGRDRIEASDNIAVTRGGYPKYPGSLLAGAVEVHAVKDWGKVFESPVGRDVGKTYHAFEYTSLFIMAAKNNTMVMLPGQRAPMRLNQGDARFVKINKGDQIKSSKNIQVDLITGDINSSFELRWYSLWPLEKWSNSYVTPVGDTYGRTRVLVYNPSRSKTLLIRTEYGRSSYDAAQSKIQKRTVIIFKPQFYYQKLPPKQYGLTLVIPTMSGAKIDAVNSLGRGKYQVANDNFIALSLTDTVKSIKDQNKYTRGEWFDWGYPLVPTNQLTPQVNIGWGFGCTNNSCLYRGRKQRDRSVVWITPVADARIYVDFTNSGTKSPASIFLKRLQSVKVTDPSDDDMSGALIYAKDKSGKTVDIAAAWGQDPAVSRSYQQLSLDLGTTVLPTTIVSVAKSVNKDVVKVGGELIYKIVVTNNGQLDVPTNDIVVKDVLDENVEYVPGSTVYVQYGNDKRKTRAGFSKIADNASGTKFPLDDSGYKHPKSLCRRGCKVVILFKVKVLPSTKSEVIVNKGVMTTSVNKGPEEFRAGTRVDFSPSIDVQNTVYLGWSKGSGCATAKEVVMAPTNYALTYCFKVTNTGKHTTLKDVTLVNKYFRFASKVGTLKPGESKMLYYQSKIGRRSLENHVVASGMPVLSNGRNLDECGLVRDTDPSKYIIRPLSASVKAINTVMLKKGATVEECKKNTVKEVADIAGTDVTYCFTGVNSGQTHLLMGVVNRALGIRPQYAKGAQPPGKSITFPFSSTIKRSFTNTLVVGGQICTPTGSRYNSKCGAKPLYASDKSAVKLLTLSGSVLVQNKVYIGHDGGKKCNTREAVDDVTDVYGTNVTYCFKLLNNGAAHLINVALDNRVLNYKHSFDGDVIPPKGERTVHFESTITTRSLTNLVVATGSPVTADKRSCGNSVTSKDTSKVNQKMHEPSINVENKVVLGSSPGLCRSADLQETVEGLEGSPVVYCFLVSNTGNSHLKNIELSNDQLKYKTVIEELAPKISTVVAVPLTIPRGTTLIKNVVNVRANPTLADGTDIPNHPHVSDKDDSNVKPVRAVGTVEIKNTVYPGTNEGDCEEKGKDTITGYVNTPAMYCFTVMNKGNTDLKSVVVSNRSFNYEKTIPLLKKGEKVILHQPSEIKETANNVATVEAVPFVNDLTLTPVKHQDWSDVKRQDYDASIEVKSTVYKGDDEGDKCKLSSETSIADIIKTQVVYCITVTNTGKVPIDDVTVVNPVLNFKKEVDSILDPNETVVYHVAGEIEEDLKNTANVTGQPLDPDGNKLPVDPVTDSSSSEVKKLVYTAAIAVTNVAHLGHVDGDACQNGKELVTDRYLKPITYCFEVTNKSEKTHLRKLIVNNRDLDHASRFDDIDLPPGGTKLIVVQGTIEEARDNSVYVEAIPHTPDGRKICDLEPVKASDPSAVAMTPTAPVVSVRNTVHVGPRVDGKCETTISDVARGKFGTVVTYCFKVTNEGETALTDFYIQNDALGYNEQDSRTLKPTESFMVEITDKKIPGENMENVVKVFANPVTIDSGADIPHYEDVNATDPSSVEVVPVDAGITVVHTLYKGTDPQKCLSGKSTLKELKDFPDTKVIHCMMVKNSGKSHLGSATLTNEQISYSQTTKPLAPGEVVYFHKEHVLGTKENKHVAVVTAKPTTPAGEIIPNTDPVSDSDSTKVMVNEYTHGISIDNRVSAAGKSCKRAREKQEGFMNTPVKYCFLLANKGTSNLSKVVISNVDLDYEVPLAEPLLAGQSKLITLDGTITGDLVNTAKVSSVATTQYGVEIPGATPSAEDDSEVARVYRKPGVKVTAVVYKGDIKDEETCESDAAKNEASGVYGTQVVFCYTVENTGDTKLGGIEMKNDVYNEVAGATIPPLEVGEKFVYMVKSSIVDDQKNTVNITANPIEKNGDDITYLQNVGDVDDVEVFHEKLTGGIKVGNTVNPSGEECGLQTEMEGTYNTDVSYCLTVTNEGPTWLDTVTLEDLVLGVKEDIGVLKPLEVKTIKVSSKITEDIKNTAVATGKPCLESGQQLPYLGTMTSKADSAVRRVETPSSVEITNHVYLKTGDDRKECEQEPQKLVKNFKGAEVVYCFNVKNTGESALSNIVLNNSALRFVNETLIGVTLLKGESMMVPIVRQIMEDLDNTIEVKALPSLDSGVPIPDTAAVIDDDDSAVKKLAYEAKIGVKHLVYKGDDTTGAGCGTALSEVKDKKDTAIVYCIEVKNDSNVRLNNIRVTNDAITYSTTIDHLMPGAKSSMLYTPSKIDLKVTNTATATGTPALASGALISGAVDVSASATTIVRPTLSGDVKTGDKDPFKPPTDPEKCIQDNWKAAGKPGDLVCAAKDIVTMSNLNADDTPVKTCKPGDKITISVDGSITIKGQRRDVGWYLATDGGDALTGTCAVNGFQKQNSYTLVDAPGSATKVGNIRWLDTRGGDNDTCGDAVLDAQDGTGVVDLPVIVDTTVTCQDENEDGVLDVAVCFTWRDTNDVACDLAKNIPDVPTGSCYCTRYDIPEVEVETPPVAAC